MQRPRAMVVAKSAMVPDRVLVEPAPNQFTHELLKRQPYYYGTRAAARASGSFEKGTHVVLMVHDGGRMCRVVNRQGLYVLTAFTGLTPLTQEPGTKNKGRRPKDQ